MANVKLVFGEKETKAPVSSQNTSSKVRLTFAGGQPTKETASSTNTSRPLNLAQTQAAQKAAVVQERDVGVRQSQYDREMARLENLRRPAAVDLDMTTLNRVNDQMKAMRAAAGKQEDPDFLTRIVSTAKGTAERQLAGHAGTVETLLTGLGKLGSFLQDKKDAKQAAQDREYLAQHEKELAEALAAGDEEAAKWAQIKINQAKYRLKTNGDLGDYYDSVTEKAIADVDAYGDKMYAAAEEDFSTAKQGANAIGRLAVDAGSAVSDFAADAVGNFILPGLGTIGRISRTFGHGSEAAQSKDLGFGRQLAYGATSAAVGEGINRLFSGNPILEKATGRGALDDILIPFLGNTAGGRTLRSGIGEAIEGGAEGIIDIGAQKIILGDKADQKTVKDVGYDALIGFLVGDITGGLSGIGNAMARRQTDPLTREYAAQTDPLTREYLRQTQSAPQGPAVPAAGQKNTASTNRGEAAEVVKVLADNIPILQTKEPVATTSANVFREIQGNTMAEKARKLFQDIKGIVTREGFGAIEINGRSVKDDLSHGVGPAKVATISVVPQVIQHGEQIDFQQNWKGRGYDGYTFAAPIVMDGEPVYVAAVVKKTSKNRFYLHEVVDSNGNIIKIDDEESANPTSLATNGDAGTQSPSPVEGMHPLNVNPTIPQSADSVNTQNDGLGAADAGSLNSAYDNLQAQSSSFYPEGANAARPVDVPTRDFEGRVVSRFASNLMGAQGVTEETVATVEQMVADGLLSADVLHNTDALAAAENTIAGKNGIGVEGAMERLRQAVAHGETSPELIAMMEVLLIDSEAASTRNEGRSAELALLGSQLSRSAARSQQLLSHLRKMSPTYQLQTIENTVRSMEETRPNRRGRREKKNARTTETVTSNLISGDAVESIASLPGWQALAERFLAAQTVEERNAVVSDMQQFVADNMRRSWGDRLVGWITGIRYMNMLGNFRTPIRNVLGNIGNRFLYEVDNAIVAAVEGLAGGRLGQTRSVVVGRALKDAAKADADAVASQLLEGGGKYADSRNPISQNEFMRGVAEKQAVFGDIFGVQNPLEMERKAVDWIMNNRFFGDEAFLRSGYARFLSGYLKANGVSASEWNDPDWQRGHQDFVERARNNSIRLAKEAAFRQDNAFSSWVGKIGRRPDTPWYIRVATEGVQPFRKTPANVFLSSVEHSPAGLFNAVIKAVQKAAGTTNKDGTPKVTGTDILESLAKTASGSLLVGLGFVLAKAGLLRGGPDEDDEQAAFDDLVGHQDYAIELPDGTSFTIDWMSPSAVPVIVGAETAKKSLKEGIGIDTVLTVLTAMSDPMLEMSFVSGLKDAIDEAKYSESTVEQIAINAMVNYALQAATSTLGGQLERSFQEQRMTTYVDKNSDVPDFLQRTLGKASQKIPLWDYNQIPYIDAWGREEETGDLGWRLLNNAANPAYVSQVEVDKVESELQRLKDAVTDEEDLTFFPTRAEKTFEVSGEDKYLSADQYVTYAKAKGQNSYKLVQDAIKMPGYKSMSDREKAEFVTKMYGYANYKAKQSVFPSYTSDAYTKYEEAEAQGITPAEFYLYKSATSDLKADKDANGESISGSKKEKVIAAINDMDFLSRTEKDWVYLLSYHGEDAQKDLRKAPWNQ